MKLLFMLIFVMTGCSEKFSHTTGRNHGPEAIGGGGHLFGIEVSESRNTYITSDMLASPFVPYDKPTDTSFGLDFKYGYNIFPILDFNFAAGPNRPLSSGLHLQLWGAPLKSASAGNFSGSARVSYGIALITGEEVAKDGINRKWIFSRYEVDYDLAMGYRVTAPILIFVGYYHIAYGMGGDGFTEGIRDQIDLEGDKDGLYLGLGYTLLPYDFKLSINKNWFKSERFGHHKDLNFGLQLNLIL